MFWNDEADCLCLVGGGAPAQFTTRCNLYHVPHCPHHPPLPTPSQLVSLTLLHLTWLINARPLSGLGDTDLYHRATASWHCTQQTAQPQHPALNPAIVITSNTRLNMAIPTEHPLTHLLQQHHHASKRRPILGRVGPAGLHVSSFIHRLTHFRLYITDILICFDLQPSLGAWNQQTCRV